MPATYPCYSVLLTVTMMPLSTLGVVVDSRHGAHARFCCVFVCIGMLAPITCCCLQVAIKLFNGLSDGQLEQLASTVDKLARTTHACTHVAHYIMSELGEPGQLKVASELFGSSLAQLLASESSTAPAPSYTSGKTTVVHLSHRPIACEREPLPLSQAIGIAKDMARGLIQLHACGVSAGALRPSTVLLDSTGKAHVGHYGLQVHTATIQKALSSPDVVDRAAYS
jgi:hypothetical protein